MTVSLDGYFTGPDDGPGRGLGAGGERLHYWVFGGPWSYDRPPTGEATGAKDVSLMGGDVIRQALAARRLDELTVSVAPVLLGAGKRLFDESAATAGLEQLDVVHSPWVTHLRYRIKAEG